jgi:5-methylcytosine-specific restriction endonuclease McrA
VVMSSVMRRPVLVLNGSFEPLRITSAQRALTMVCKGTALVEVPTDIQAHKGIFVPSVIRLRTYRHVPIRLQVVSRRNIFMRDGERCMYCGERFRPQELTLDHVIPKSRGGASSWDNMVACCAKDNHRKADRTPEEAGMMLIHRPLPQNIHTPRFLLRAIAIETVEWSKYLWTDSDGDRRYVTVN